MPKKSKLPGFRAHVRRGKAGQVWTYYMLDRRSQGLPDLNLGSDYAAALAAYRAAKVGVTSDRGIVSEAIKRWVSDELTKYEVPKTRADYGRHAKRMMLWCGSMRWESVTLPLLVEYTRRRQAKTQANRELAVLSIVWGWARRWGMTRLVWPAAGIKGWKNPEKARISTLDMEVFDAVYEFADQTLRDAMDIASATGMRLTDVRTIMLPDGHRIEIDASKTGKPGWFDVHKSSVLPPLIERRRGYVAKHGYLLSMPSGRPLSERTLGRLWSVARAAATLKAMSNDDALLADRISTAWIKDSRKLAANLAPDIEAASKLLQHSSTAVTRKHYRTAADELPPQR